jgi:hypothetical protein
MSVANLLKIVAEKNNKLMLGEILELLYIATVKSETPTPKYMGFLITI